jgi:DinB superfamily
VTTPESVIAQLENAPGVIIPLIREVPVAIMKRRPLPGKWSAHEHACHLAEVHPLFFSRLDLMLGEANPRITPYDPSKEMEEDALLKLDLYESMGRFSSDRRKLVERLKGLTASDWQRTAEHEEYTHYSIFIMFRHLALHDMLHAYRIEELLLKKDWDG